jgi:hypothetical protein
VCFTGLTGVELFCGGRQVSPVGTGLTGATHRSDWCWSVDSSFGVALRSQVCDVGEDQERPGGRWMTTPQ